MNVVGWSLWPPGSDLASSPRARQNLLRCSLLQPAPASRRPRLEWTWPRVRNRLAKGVITLWTMMSLMAVPGSIMSCKENSEIFILDWKIFRFKDISWSRRITRLAVDSTGTCRQVNSNLQIMTTQRLVNMSLSLSCLDYLPVSVHLHDPRVGCAAAWLESLRSAVSGVDGRGHRDLIPHQPGLEQAN